MTPQEIEALKSERDALAARIQTAERVEKIFSEIHELKFDDCLKLFADEIRNVQAEAGRKGFIECSTRWNLCNAFGEFVLPEEIEAVADEYAATVRQGGAE